MKERKSRTRVIDGHFVGENSHAKGWFAFEWAFVLWEWIIFLWLVVMGKCILLIACRNAKTDGIKSIDIIVAPGKVSLFYGL